MDISFVSGQDKFNYRVCAILLSGNKVLAMHDERSPYYYLPGGRVRMGETAEHAVVREVEEELNIKAKIVRPLWLNQGFFTEDVDKLNYHEICLYFLMDVSETGLLEKGGRFTIYEGQHTHDFEWLEFERLQNEYFYPIFLKTEIFKLQNRVKKDWQVRWTRDSRTHFQEEKKMMSIVPYKGFDDITFEMSFNEVKEFLREKQIKFNTENWPNKGCDPEVAWDIIRIGKNISIFFAMDRMFKIYFENDFPGRLENGISLGMNIKDAKMLDDTIEYDDWEEVYTSGQGYWLEDDVENGEIISITIFIKELEDDDVFFRYDWCNDPD